MADTENLTFNDQTYESMRWISEILTGEYARSKETPDAELFDGDYEKLLNELKEHNPSVKKKFEPQRLIPTLTPAEALDGILSSVRCDGDFTHVIPPG